MCRVWDAGIDYLTITFKAGDRDYVRAMLLVKSEMEKTADGNNAILPWAWNGYRGEKQGKVMYGEREDGLLVRCSGARARLIAAIFKENNVTGKATRIDFQVTAKTKQAVEEYLEITCAKVTANTDSTAGRSARNSATYKSRGRACGMVIGSRSSTNYHRIYNKTLEQRNRVEPNLVRFEAEKKGDLAVQSWKMYMMAGQPYYLNCSIIKAEMEILGVDMDWLAYIEKAEFVSSYEPTTPVRQANWLFVHVRPTVLKLVALIGRDAVLELLGLDL